MWIRINDTVNDSIVDGVGLRYTIFVQGCSRHCPGCHNPQTHDPDGGRPVTVQSLVNEAVKNPLIDGITISGGEPAEQPHAVAELAMYAKLEDLTVWMYTGYRFEELQEMGYLGERLGWFDVIVDGAFVEGLKSYEARFRGSTNQRIIDVQKSLKEGKVILWEG